MLENPLASKYDQKSIIARRNRAIALSQEDLKDHKTLRIAIDQPQDDEPATLGATTSTNHRLEIWPIASRTSGLSKPSSIDFIVIDDSPPESLILGFDATDSEIHGHQESQFFHDCHDCGSSPPR